MVFELDGDAVRLRSAESKILRWYGSVEPRNRPEDWQAIRREFEEGVAAEVTAKTE